MALNKTTIDLKFDQNLASHTFSRKHIATKRHLRFFFFAGTTQSRLAAEVLSFVVESLN